MESIGKLLLLAGGALIVIGLLVVAAGRLGLPLGRLPGDIIIQRGSFTFYFPLVTGLLLSVILTIVATLVLRFLSR